MLPEGLHIVQHHPRADHPPVVIVHGQPDRSKNFARVLHLLTDLPVTAYDRRGYGKSLDATPTALGFSDHADDLIAIMGGTPSIVVGQSAGGTIAMMAATRAPELFLALGVWEPPLTAWDWWAQGEAWDRTAEHAMFCDAELLGETFNRLILGDERWESLPERTRDLLRAEGRQFRADMTCQLVKLFDLDDLTVPFLVGYGDQTPPFGQIATSRLAERMGAEVFVGEGADHFAHTGSPAVWAELVRRTVALAERNVSRHA
ncbi:MAG: alpha/beta fold hydrolase [Acidimicrobiia bacterium]